MTGTMNIKYYLGRSGKLIAVLLVFSFITEIVRAKNDTDSTNSSFDKRGTVTSNMNSDWQKLNEHHSTNGDESCLVSLWHHSLSLDPTDLIEQLGVNHVWSSDPDYTGQAWESTHMYELLQIPDLQVLGKIERVAWGRTHEISLNHAEWVASKSVEYPRITGIYLNDFYDEIEDGYRTEEEWREIIDVIRDINPDLQIWVPHYPHRDQHEQDFDFDIDVVIANLWGNSPGMVGGAENSIMEALEHHPDRPVMAGLYLRSGPHNRWLTEEEFRHLMSLYVRLVNEGKIFGLRLFAVYQFKERPEYIEWASEELSKLKCRDGYETAYSGEPEKVSDLELKQNYPNPFNPSTAIVYHLPDYTNVQLDVYDMLGRKIESLVDTWQASGKYTVHFDASGLSSGIYIYRLQAGESTYTRRMMLVK